jgi:PEP-CTERM/exosortase A-associated glycosyltransferase
MSVLHVVDHSLPIKDGYAFRTHAILLAQAERGWRPAALTSPKHFEDRPDALVSTDPDRVGPIAYYRTPPAPSIRLPVVSELRQMRLTRQRLHAVAAIERPRVLHAHSPTLDAFPALQAGRRLRLPVVYEVRASWEDAAVSSGKYTERSWKYAASKYLETRACLRAHHVTVLCDGIRRDLVSRGVAERKITVIPNGVDIDVFRPATFDPRLAASLGLEGKKVVGFVGSFFRWEGLDLLVEAIAALARTRDDVALLLVGGGEVAADLKRQVESLGIAARVRLPGSVPQSEVGRYYGIADVLVYPRHSSRLTELVTPLKPLEAMAMGRAVVASDVGGHRELIDHGRTGLLFRAGDTADLARALVEVLDHDGRAWVVRERTWRRTTEGYAAVYRAVGADLG